MKDKTKRIEEYAVEGLAVLKEYGFLRPTVKKDKWSTTISSLSSDIAVEVELDWRDLDVFVLVTALSDGKLPGGYYVFNGKRCRIHLEDVLKDICGVSDVDVCNLLKKQPANSDRDEATMKSRLDFYMELLKKYISVIQQQGLRLFK